MMLPGRIGMIVCMVMVIVMRMIMAMAVIVAMMPVARMAVIGNAAIAMLYAPVRQMCMVMAVIVKGKPAGRRTKQTAIILALADNGWRSAAADMAVEADHRIGTGHHHMQIMGNHQDAAAFRIANAANQFVKRGFAGKIHPLHRLVQHQEIGISGNGTGKQRTLELAARQMLDFSLEEMCNADGLKRLVKRYRRKPARQMHQTLDSQRHRPVDRQLLRHIANLEVFSARDAALIGP